MNRLIKSQNLLIAAAITWASHGAFAADGDFDTTFDGGGIVVTDFATQPGEETWASAVIQQKDGKLVATGSANTAGVIVRYLPDGSLDNSFAGDGRVTIDIPYSEMWDVIQQSDGKLVAGGVVDGDFALVRYNANGSPDATFGTGGVVSTEFGTDLSSVSAITQLGDGKLLAAGSVRWFSDEGDFQSDFALVRYLPNGALDSSFGSGGSVRSDFSQDVDRINDVIEQHDGKLLVVGFMGGYQGIDGNDQDIAIARYLPDGALDTTFGVNGLLQLGVISYGVNSGDGASSVIQLADDRLVIAGFGEVNGTSMVMVCLMPDGSLDTNFGNNGVVSGPLGFRASALVRQADGKLVLSGSRLNELGSDYAWVRYEADGTLDSSFGVDGMVVLPNPNTTNYNEALSLIQQYDGKLVAALYEYGPDTNYTSNKFSLARIDSGQPDTDADGYVDGLDVFPDDATEWFDTDNDGVGNNADTDDDDDGLIDSVDNCPLHNNVSQYDADGDGVGDVCDSTPNGPDTDGDGFPDFADNCPLEVNPDQVDINEDGVGDSCHVFDNSFGNNGKVVTNDNMVGNPQMIQQHDGKLVVVSEAYDQGYTYHFLLIERYNVDGSLDSTFNNSGKIFINNNYFDVPAGIVEQSDGKLVLAGTSYSPNPIDHNIFMMRFMPDGAVDNTFGINDRINVTVSGKENRIFANAVIAQANNKLLIAGYSNVDPDDKLLLIRVDADGNLDTSFNGTGIAGDIPLAAEVASHLFAVTEQTDGKLAIVGQTYSDSGNAYTLTARYNSNGTLDTSFRGSGFHELAVPFGAAINSSGYSVLQQPDGKLVTGGVAWDAGINGYAAFMVRYNVDGSLDTSFSQDGILVSRALSGFSAMTLQSDGKLVMLGRISNTVFSAGIGVMRFNPDGSADPTFFNTNGKLSFIIGHSSQDYPGTILQQKDGKLTLVAQHTGYAANHTDIALVRLLSGQPDTDGDGVVDWLDNDNDNDGMPNSWEIQYGLNSLVNDANGDLDGDGLTNLQEYTNDSNPTTVVSFKNDYNHDGIAGWIWKGQSNGVETQSQNWQLSFPLYSNNWAIPSRSFHPTFADQANWEIVTSGDFNKDGDADIVWRHKTTDAWKIWQMQDGLRVAQTNWTDSFDPSHEWTVVGAGDSDNDGDDDIILNNASTGDVLIWEIQNYAVVATHNVGTKAGYSVNRIGDFNKDGDVDLLFRQNGGDALITWEIQANAFVTERALANTGAGYNPVCAADFDHDGDDDIMLVNSSTNQEKWFVMENYTRTQQFGGTNAGFVLLGCGDYDGDGDADSLWQRSSDQLNRVVLQQNWGATKQTVYTNAFGTANGFVYRGNSN